MNMMAIPIFILTSY